MGWKVEAAADDGLQGGAVMSTRVLAVDKHVAFRHDLALYLTLLDQGYEVIGEAGTAADALARVGISWPDAASYCNWCKPSATCKQTSARHMWIYCQVVYGWRRQRRVAARNQLASRA